MTNYNMVLEQASELRKTEGVALSDVLELPLALRTFLLRIVQRRGMTATQVGTFLETTLESGDLLCQQLVELGWLQERPRGDSAEIHYRLKFATSRGREQFRDVWGDAVE